MNWYFILVLFLLGETTLVLDYCLTHGNLPAAFLFFHHVGDLAHQTYITSLFQETSIQKSVSGFSSLRVKINTKRATKLQCALHKISDISHFYLNSI